MTFQLWNDLGATHLATGVTGAALTVPSGALGDARNPCVAAEVMLAVAGIVLGASLILTGP